MKCYLCGSKKSHKREGKVRDNPSINILECDECGLVFLDTQITSDEFYTQGNMHNQEEVYKMALRTDLINDGHSFNLVRYDFIKESLIGKTLLDFGSGYAGFLRFAKDLAKSVVGVELEEQVRPIYEKYNIPLARTLEEAKNLNTGGGL